MRVLIILPSLPHATGNQVTARRYADGLTALGHAVDLLEVQEEDSVSIAAAVDRFGPDLVHLLHAYRTGKPWLACSAAAAMPMVVTLTGTDLDHDLHTPARGPIVRAVLAGAAAVILHNRLAAAALRRTHPELAGRLQYLPPGIALGNEPYPLRQVHGVPPGRFLFLHPAGIRPVKGNLELLQMFDAIAADTDFTVLFCGPILDEEYGREFLAALSTRPWARYGGIVPPAAMAAALAAADVVLNNSVSEGLSNALLEAAALGRPILARRIPGNAAVVAHGRNGLLFTGEVQFRRFASRLANDGAFHRTLCRPQPDRFSAGREARGLARLYRRLPPPAGRLG